MTGSWVVFVFIGDSITAGYQQGPGSLPPRYYPFTNMLESTIRMRLKERGSEKDVAIENRGMDGDSTSGMVNRFTMSVTSEKPEYVVIMGGSERPVHTNPGRRCLQEPSASHTDVQGDRGGAHHVEHDPYRRDP